MQYFLWLNERSAGPFEAVEVRGMLEKGEITWQTLCARNGEQDWKPLAEYRQTIIPPKPPDYLTVAGALQAASRGAGKLYEHLMRTSALRLACLLAILAVVIGGTKGARTMSSWAEPSGPKERWEYKTAYVENDHWEHLRIMDEYRAKHPESGYNDGSSRATEIAEHKVREECNKLGAEGWELVGTYLEPETGWTRVDDKPKEYLPGGKVIWATVMQPNVRAGRLVMIFKRPKQ